MNYRGTRSNSYRPTPVPPSLFRLHARLRHSLGQLLQDHLSDSPQVPLSGLRWAMTSIIIHHGGNIDGAIAGYRELTGAAPMYGKWATATGRARSTTKTARNCSTSPRNTVLARSPSMESSRTGTPGRGRENWNQLFFDPKKFPEPAEMVDILHGRITISCFYLVRLRPHTRRLPGHGEARIPLSPGGLGWLQVSSMPSPEATASIGTYVKAGFFSKGLDGWWMDSTEPDIVNARPRNRRNMR